MGSNRYLKLYFAAAALIQTLFLSSPLFSAPLSTADRTIHIPVQTSPNFDLSARSLNQQSGAEAAKLFKFSDAGEFKIRDAEIETGECLDLNVYIPNIIQTFSTVQQAAPPPPKPIFLHRSTYKAEIDIDFSPYAGGEDLLLATRAAEWIERLLLDFTPLAGSKSAYARTWRLSELTLLWLPLNYYAAVIQHEVFGHGYRLRDLGRSTARVIGYFIATPPPYGGGGGYTSYQVSNQYTTTQENSVCSAGVEASFILAQLTKFKWLESGYIDPRQSILYLLAQQDLTLYIGSLKVKGEQDLSGHDIHHYIQSLNETYTNSKLSSGKLRTLSWINWADPFTYYAIYSWFHYLSSGKESKIPLIPIWGAGYLPGFRIGLTPFGPEICFDNYLVQQHRPYYFYIKGGLHSDNNYWGAGFYAPKIGKIWKFLFGARFDAWRQPKLLLTPGRVPIEAIDSTPDLNAQNPLYPYNEQHKMKMGCAASGIIYFRASPRYGAEAELGYKMNGFLPGYSLTNSPVARLALAFVF